MTLNVSGSMTSTVPAVLLGTYTRGGSKHKGQGTTPESVFEYTFTAEVGSGVCCTSGAGSRRAGSVSIGAAGCATLGEFQTTANTTAAGLTITRANRIAEAIRTGLDLTRPANALLVREIFKFGGELTHPPPIVQAADEATVALVACDVQELLLGNQRPQPGQVRISAVAHDPADHARKLPPLAFRKRFAVAGDRHQERRRRARDGLRKELVRLGAGDDLAARADDVGDPVPAHPDDVASAADSGSFEV